jgi:putative sugar O-methyltransferase
MKDFQDKVQFIKSLNPNKIIKKLRQKRVSTSISDNQIYPDFCNKAAMRSDVFNDFRSKKRKNKPYRRILEHVSRKNGGLYLEEITKNNPGLLNHMISFKENDLWGNPQTQEYGQIGKISPTTLRYIKVMGDLINLFGSLDDLNICEIGVGYGGQCRIINSLMAPSKYTLVDIKPALRLAQKYLDNYVLKSVVDYKTMNELDVRNYDLLISNYAFSELSRSIQDVYLSKIVLNSSKGYITFNEISPEKFNSYKREELIGIIPNSRIVEERPLTHRNNCIIHWGE